MVCIICLALMLALVVVYRNGAKLGIRPLDKQERLSELSASAVISLSDTKIKVKGKGAHSDDGVITIAYAGEYTFTGSCSNARIVVQADKKAKVKLIFDNAELSCANAPVIYIANAGKTTLYSQLNTRNVLRSEGGLAEEYANGGVNAAVFSKDDLILDGKGSLNVYSGSAHGIVSKDDLKLKGGSWRVEAASDALRGKDSIVIEDGSYTLLCGGDGMKSSNEKDEDKGSITVSGGNISIDAGKDGIQAYRDIVITGGTLDITTGGGVSENSLMPLSVQWIRPSDDMPQDSPGSGNPPEPPSGEIPPDSSAPSGAPIKPDGKKDKDKSGKISQKGIKAGRNISVTGGSFELNCADDTLHCHGELLISGGSLMLKSGDDAAHANQSLRMEGGVLAAAACVEGLEAKQVAILGGSVDVTSSDDGINANGRSRGVDMSRLLISGGSIKLHTYGDGVDSNGDIIITGGSILISADPSDGNSAVDYGIENGGDCTISGGSIVACGFAGMAEMFSEASAQCSVLYAFEEAFEGGTKLSILDSSGSILLSYTPENTFDCVVFSSPEIQKGSTYTLLAGSETFTVTPDNICGRYGVSIQRPSELPGRDPAHMGGFGN